MDEGRALDRLPVLLCSASPRRSQLLLAAGIPFERGAAPQVDETPPEGVEPEAAAEEIARRKAVAASARAPGRLVLTADTVVVLDGRILGKPGTREASAGMLRALSGRSHRVATGVAVVRDGHVRSDRDVAVVTFRALSEEQVLAYARSEEGVDKAGGYAIQGRGAAFVASLEGSSDTVVGLPIAVVRRLLDSARTDDR
jgi:septum formation protein